MPYKKKQDSGQEHSAGQNQGSRGEDEYSFLQETIKPEPISREKLLKQFARIAIYGAIFGAFACISFCALKPAATTWFKGEPDTVTIPEDEEPEDEEEKSDTQTEPEQPPEVVLDMDHYREMAQVLYDTVQEAQKGVVSVAGRTETENWDGNATGIEESVSGIITADNGQELLILAPDQVCEGAQAWAVTFSDESRYEAALKKRDRNTGLAMFSVDRSAISNATWSQIKVSSLGNSNLAKQGSPVIALGNMYGYPDGIGYGVVSSTAYKASFYDGECKVIATDISLASAGTGALFNISGEVIGLIVPGIWKEMRTANAYAVSDMKPVIELLANGVDVPYIGVSGIEVTEEMCADSEMPQGIYVAEVDPESPAMAAGIQSGDILLKVNDEPAATVSAYQRMVRKAASGQEIKITGMRRGADGYVEVVYTVTVGSRS